MGNCILITGVAGFLGRTLARYYFEKGWDVIGVDVVAPENSPAPFLKTYLCDSLPSPSFIQLLKDAKPSECIHCAGRSTVGGSIIQPYSDFVQGPQLTFYVLDCLREFVPGCKFLLLSSAAVYGNPVKIPIDESLEPAPISPYGFHKWQSEIICREFNQIYGIPTANVRIFSAYGPGLRRQVVYDICRKIIFEKHVQLHGTGLESRDFIFASDVARGLETVITNGELIGEAYNLSSGTSTTIHDLVQLIQAKIDITREVCYDGVNPTGNPLDWQADISKIQKIGFSPQVSLGEGIETTALWCKSELMG